VGQDRPVELPAPTHVLLRAEQVAQKVAELGAQITADYAS